jgi:hypothetical protein
MMPEQRKQSFFRQSILGKLHKATPLTPTKTIISSHGWTVRIPNRGQNQILTDGMSAKITSIPEICLEIQSRNRELGSINVSGVRVSAATSGRIYFVDTLEWRD